MTTAPLPSSGDPGGRPPPPEALPAPALWPQRQGAEQPFSRLRDEEVPARTPGAVRGSWTAAALMVVGVVLLGTAVVLQGWLLAAVGLGLGLGGLVLAWRVRIFNLVELGTAAEAQERGDQAGGPATP